MKKDDRREIEDKVWKTLSCLPEQNQIRILPGGIIFCDERIILNSLGEVIQENILCG